MILRINCFCVIRKVIFPMDVSCYLRCKDIDKQTVFIPSIGCEMKHSGLWCHVSLFEGITYSFPWLCWMWNLQVRTYYLMKAIKETCWITCLLFWKRGLFFIQGILWKNSTWFLFIYLFIYFILFYFILFYFIFLFAVHSCMTRQKCTYSLFS